MSEINSWWRWIISMGSTVLKKSEHRTAMDPILKFISLVSIPCLITWYFARFWPLLLIGVIPVLYFIRVFEHFMKHDSKMLRTEKHEETMFRIASAMGQKDNILSEEKIDALPSTIAPNTSKKTKPELIIPKTKKGKNE